MIYESEVMAWLDNRSTPYIHRMSWEAPDVLTFLRTLKEYYKGFPKWKLIDWSLK